MRQLKEPVIAVVIPVYNHRQELRAVVENVLQYHSGPLIVVDDGSTDGGAGTLKKLPVTLIRFAVNKGKGTALLAGARAASERGCTHIITIDADGQHNPSDIPRFCMAIRETPSAIIAGRRNFKTPNVPRSSRFGRAFANFWMRVQTGVAIGDTQSGFRAYPLQLFSCIALNEKRYGFETEILVRAAWAGFAIRELPVNVYYPKAAQRVSHFRAVRDNIDLSLLNTRLTLRALTPLPFQQYQDKNGAISLLKPLESLRRLLRGRDTPRHLAKSAAIAVSISALPLPGLQSILLLLAIGCFRLNRMCALVMIPLSWPPVVPGLGVLLGYRLRNGRWLTEFSLQTLGYEAPQRALDWLAGGVCLSPLLGAVIWLLTYILAKMAHLSETKTR